MIYIKTAMPVISAIEVSRFRYFDISVRGRATYCAYPDPAVLSFAILKVEETNNRESYSDVFGNLHPLLIPKFYKKFASNVKRTDFEYY